MGRTPACVADRLSPAEQRVLACFLAGRLPAGQVHEELARARGARARADLARAGPAPGQPDQAHRGRLAVPPGLPAHRGGLRGRGDLEVARAALVPPRGRRHRRAARVREPPGARAPMVPVEARAPLARPLRPARRVRERALTMGAKPLTTREMAERQAALRDAFKGPSPARPRCGGRRASPATPRAGVRPRARSSRLVAASPVQPGGLERMAAMHGQLLRSLAGSTR